MALTWFYSALIGVVLSEMPYVDFTCSDADTMCCMAHLLPALQQCKVQISEKSSLISQILIWITQVEI